MQSVSYMGNDETTEFYFNFPYFETSNVVVMVNNEPAPTYNIIGTPGGENADFPFVGGRVVFAVAPHIIDSITISRQLPLARIADYQPLARIEPTILNQDLNYLMEVIKDKQDELDDLIAKYNDIADKESTATLLAQIAAIHDEIVAIDAKITNLGDISTLRTDVTTNTNNITTNTNNIATNTGDIANLKDAANFTATGKSNCSQLSLPSSSYIEITPPAIGIEGTYVAMANGYIVGSFNVAQSKAFWLLNTDAGNLGIASYGAGGGTPNYRIFCPIAKGQTAKFMIETGSYDYLRFYYAQGEL